MHLVLVGVGWVSERRERGHDEEGTSSDGRCGTAGDFSIVSTRGRGGWAVRVKAAAVHWSPGGPGAGTSTVHVDLPWRHSVRVSGSRRGDHRRSARERRTGKIACMVLHGGVVVARTVWSGPYATCQTSAGTARRRGMVSARVRERRRGRRAYHGKTAAVLRTHRAARHGNDGSARPGNEGSTRSRAQMQAHP